MWLPSWQREVTKLCTCIDCSNDENQQNIQDSLDDSSESKGSDVENSGSEDSECDMDSEDAFDIEFIDEENLEDQFVVLDGSGDQYDSICWNDFLLCDFTHSFSLCIILC